MPKARILIADDDKLVLAVLASELRDAGYTIFEANDGSHAIRLCEEQQPDMAILDVRVPNMDGVEIGCQLQKLAGTPFLILSAMVIRSWSKEQRILVPWAISSNLLIANNWYP